MARTGATESQGPMKSPALLLAAAFLAAPAAAQDPPLAPPGGPETVAAGHYVLDSKESLVRETTIHMGFSEFWITFPDARGTLDIDPARPEAAKLTVAVPVSHLETTNRELNGELLSEEFFSEAKFKSLKFVSTAVTRTGPRTAKVAGDLTVRGVTKPVVLDVAFIGAGPNAFSKTPTVGFRAEATIRRSDFGLGKYVPIVSDEARIYISAAFEKPT
jgi:polyisoprenoid-binding protein YceI